MYRLKLVGKYTNSTQQQCLSMPCDLFQTNFKYAFIDEKMQSEEGREYLKKAERLKCTCADVTKIRKIKQMLEK